MNSSEYLNEYEKPLSYDAQLSKLYADKLGWIRARKEDWREDVIRVGVIGDTSSGKSTLINAILGMDILSSAVVPSSGVLVSCAYGTEKKMIIYFKDGGSKILKGEDVSQKNLVQYSDERHNPENQYNVASIELQTPEFELGKDVLLIDSPGLNAYGLEAHEKITLGMMVPTLDYCIYITTTKTTSDSHAREVLDTVARYGCGIMMIQNKLDAVRETPGGEKTRQQVIKEHYARLKKVVDASLIPDKERIDIIQISAINALRWRLALNEDRFCESSSEDYKESQFDLFLKMIKERLEELRLSIERVRLENIYDSIRDVTSEAAVKLDAIKLPELSLKKSNYDKKISEIEEFIDSNTFEKKSLVDRLNDSFDELRNAVNEEIIESNAKACLRRTKRVINGFGGDIFAYINYSNIRMHWFSSYVNVQNRDLYKKPVVFENQDVTFSFYEEEGQVRQKQTGMGGFINRVSGFFSKDKSKGYDYVTGTVKHLDVEAAKRDIIELLNKEGERYKKILDDRNKDYVSACEGFLKILRSEKEKFLERQTAEIEQKKLQDFYNKLYPIERELEQLVGTTIVWKAKKQAFKQDAKKIEIDDISLDILELSSKLKKIQNSQVMKSLIEHEKLEDHIPILLGWDEYCENHFAWNTGITDLNIIHLSEEEAPKERDDFDTCFFVLVNASQIGMEKKKIRAIKLSEIVKPNDYVVWVVQDFEELFNSDSTDEGLRNMLWLNEFSEISSRSIVWINHDNPIFNISFLEQQFSPKIEIAKQQEYLDYLRNNYSTYCDEFSIRLIAKSIMKVRV